MYGWWGSIFILGLFSVLWRIKGVENLIKYFIATTTIAVAITRNTVHTAGLLAFSLGIKYFYWYKVEVINHFLSSTCRKTKQHELDVFGFKWVTKFAAKSIKYAQLRCWSDWSRNTLILPHQHVSAKTPISLPVKSPSLVVVLLHMSRAAAVLAELGCVDLSWASWRLFYIQGYWGITKMVFLQLKSLKMLYSRWAVGSLRQTDSIILEDILLG